MIPLKKYISLILLIMPLALIGQDAEPVAEGGLSLWGMIKQGGWAMYPLGLCSLAMLFLIIHCWRETVMGKFFDASQVDSVSRFLTDKNTKGAVAAMNENPTVLARVMEIALKRARPKQDDCNLEKVEASLVEALEGEENSISQWITYLNVIAAIAPMIGLLGTVSGMIGAFQSIMQSGMGRPELFAGNIGEALLTTATGLCIGIPAMVMFFVMRNRLNNAMLATIQTANLLLDYLRGDMDEETEEQSPTENVL